MTSWGDRSRLDCTSPGRDYYCDDITSGYFCRSLGKLFFTNAASRALEFAYRMGYKRWAQASKTEVWFAMATQ